MPWISRASTGIGTCGLTRQVFAGWMPSGSGRTSGAVASPENEAADLLRKASDAGNASATLLFGMAQLYGNGLPKNQIDGVYIIRQSGAPLQLVVTSRRLDCRPDRSAGWPFTRDL